MNRDKIGETIGAALSTFLTVYVALRIGKAIGRRETIEEVAEFADRELERYMHDREQATTVAHIEDRPTSPRWWERDYYGLSVPSWGIVGLGVVTLALWAIVTIG